MHDYMNLACESARAGMRAGEGGPFGAVVVRGDEIIAVAHNRVLAENDPTAHAEIEAIRAACARLGTHDLSDCELYATGEPCPMCLSAMIWANIATCHYANTYQQAEKIGFRDQLIYDHLRGDANAICCTHAPSAACGELYNEYEATKREMY